MQATAEATVESPINNFDTSVSAAPQVEAWDPSKEESKSPTHASPTNLSQARVGTGNCWGTLKILQDTIVESTKAKSDLSSRYAGGARLGVASCWSKISTFAWDMSMPEVEAGKSSGETPRKSAADDSETSAAINVERLKAMAESSVKQPDMPPPEEEGATSKEMVVETVETDGDIL